MIFKPKTRIVLFDTRSPMIEMDEMFDIILSPSLYWVKRIELPVKYLHEARRLLPSLFEDTLPKGGEYSYSTYRDGDAYMIFAYDDKAIVRALNEKGIKTAHINKVYLAQSEFGSFEKAISLGGDSVMLVQDGVLIKLPSSFSDDTMQIDLDQHKFSSHHIPLARYSHIADKKSMTLFASFMLILIISLVAEWSIVHTKMIGIDEKRAELFEKYKLKSTMMQNRAILERLESRFGQQTKIRSISTSLFDLKLDEAEKMTHLDIAPEKVKTAFLVASAERVKVIATQLRSAGHIFTKKYSNGVLDLEFAL